MLLQQTRWKGSQGGDIVIPFGGVGGELKGFINTNSRGDIWVAEIDQFQYGHLTSQLQVHQGDLQKAYSTEIRMRMGHMLIHKDDMGKNDDIEDGAKKGSVAYILPPQFFKPEGQEGRVYWNQVFGGAAHLLVCL